MFTALLGLSTFVGTAWSQEDSKHPVDSKSDEKLFQFSFRHAPWEEVLKDLAEECGFESSLDVIPGGTFNYVDKKRKFTSDEAIDFINGYLLVKGYSLVRQNNLLLIIDFREDVDRNLLRDMLHEIPLRDLDERGKFEVTKTRFVLENVDAAEVVEQLQGLLTPTAGSLWALPLSKEIIATDAAGNLRQIRDSIIRMEKNAKDSEKTLHVFRLKNASSEEVMIAARPLLDIGDGENSSEDGTIKLSADPLGKTIYATGEAEKVAIVKQLVDEVDNDATLDAGEAVAQPVMDIHKVQAADPDAVLRVLQTMFVGEASLRLEIDRSTGGIMALATPDIHNSIKVVIRQMEANPDTWAVIPLIGLDPEAAVILLEKMFSTSTNPPIISGTIEPPQLVARGTQAQLRQVQLLVQQMSQSIQQTVVSRQQRGTTRLLQMSPEDADAMIQRVEKIWPQMRKNDLEVIPMPARPREEPRRPIRSYKDFQDADRSKIEEARSAKSELTKFTAFKADAVNADDTESEASLSDEPFTGTGDPVVIAVTPQGLLLNSNDTEALDEMTNLLAALGFDPASGVGGSQVFYLRHTEAETAMKLITDLMSGLTTTTTTSAEEATLVGSAIGGGDAAMASIGAPHMVTNKRLNAIYVVGSRLQINTVANWVKRLDIEAGPEEVKTFPQPRFIQVFNADATEIEAVLTKVFSNRILSQQNQQSRQNNQRGGGEERGRGGFGGFGRGGRGGGEEQQRPQATQTAAGELPKMTLGVDTINNAIVVSAPDPLYREVQQVVFEIDSQAGKQEPETIATVSLKGTNLETVKSALQGVLGDAAEISGSSTTGGNQNSTNNNARRGTTGSTTGFGGANFGRGGTTRGGGNTGRGGGNTGRGGGGGGGGDAGGGRRGGGR